MIPFYVLVITSILFRGMGVFGLCRFSSMRKSILGGMVAMFLFTGSSHFSEMKYDFLAMVPGSLPRELWVIYLTGALEIIGAIGLLIPATRKISALGLILLLGLMFPANVSAALNEVSFQDRPPTSLWLRIPLQVIYIVGLVWSAMWTTVKRYELER